MTEITSSGGRSPWVATRSQALLVVAYSTGAAALAAVALSLALAIAAAHPDQR